MPDSIARVSLLALEQVPARAEDLDQLIRWQLRKSTPFPLDEAQIHSSPRERHRDDARGGRGTIAMCSSRSEAVAPAVGIHAGIVDLASFNVVNAVIAAGSAPSGDWLVVCLAPEGTTIAILRGEELMFYRHRAAIDGEPLSALVHQTLMYHEDRLGGSTFSRVYLCGAGAGDTAADVARAEIADRLGVMAETVDVRSAAGLRDRSGAGPEVLDALAAPVGLLLRERAA